MNDISTVGTTDDIQLSHQINSCRRLWASKMALHIQDYARGVKMLKAKSNKSRQTTGEAMLNARIAYNWIFDNSEKPASFIWICSMFDINHEHARMKITHNWRKNLDWDKNVHSI